MKKDENQNKKDQEDKTPDKDERLDQGLEESFPASDPPAVTREPTPRKSDKKDKSGASS